MQFDFDLTTYLYLNQKGISILNGSQKFLSSQVSQLINKMGEASLIAQNLKQPITSSIKFAGSDQIIFLKAEENKCNGFLKVGKRKLFHRDVQGFIKEVEPICVLDFYVHESVQRKGVGKQLFEEMLQHCKVMPYQLGYDRPSQKLLAFLDRHYGLKEYIPQNNNFVIYEQFWQNAMKKSQNSKIYEAVTPQSMQIQQQIEQTKKEIEERENQQLGKIRQYDFQNQDRSDQSSVMSEKNSLMSAYLSAKKH